MIACSAGIRVSQDPNYKSFYEKARLIMTEDEKKIYKSLPDDSARQEFVDEFWKIRDPDPGTEENEAKVEFEERIRYANQWFGSYNPRRGQESKDDAEEHSRIGWDEDRGRVYIVLGPPDVVYYFSNEDESVRFDGARDRVRTDEWTTEDWVYDRYRLAVVFRKTGAGNWFLDSFDQQFFEVMEWAKLNWVSSDFKEDIKKSFRFKSDFKNSGIRVTIPVNRVNFDENFKAEFAVKINIYRDHRKVDTIYDTRILQENEEELLKKKNVEFDIPFRPDKKGSYLFDVIIQDRMAPSLSKYRVFVKHKA
jgi:GWxTD domain-containing protein